MSQGEPGGELLVCGADEVFVIRPQPGQAGPPKKVWSWRAADRPELPDHVRPLFGSTDECKPIHRDGAILITSSGGGVALADSRTGRASFWARAANAHSADLLPAGRVAVAASHDPGGQGDRLIVFDLHVPERELLSTELPWGHGVVWDQDRATLWALSNNDVRAYRLQAWDSASPRLQRISTTALPESGGHDLLAVPGTAMLSVTTAQRCWLFDCDSGLIHPHPQLAETVGVKCISVNPVSGRLVYVQAEGDDWWAERLRFMLPEGTLRLAGERLYKARWCVAP